MQLFRPLQSSGRKTGRKSLWHYIRSFFLYLIVGIILWLAFATLWGAVLPVVSTPLILWRAVNLTGGFGWSQSWTPLEQIPAYVPRAAIASEDNNFCAHNGIDWQAVNKVYTEWKQGGRKRGASTITMQVARNIYLWPNQDVVRKALEVPLSYLIESIWGKRRIMEVYLNVAEWGPGVYGIAAAARYHYKKPLKQLKPYQINTLIALLPSPRYWTPANLPSSRRIRSTSFQSRINHLGSPAFACLK